MATTKRIVCLANSRKQSGYCVAGKEIDAGVVGEWIRPVSSREHEEVSDGEERCTDRALPQLLDFIDIPLIRKSNNSRQPENWLLDPSSRWKRQGGMRWHGLFGMNDSPAQLWSNDSHSGGGIANRVALDEADNVDASLYLLKLSQLRLHVTTETFDGRSKRPVRAEFSHAKHVYRLSLTDGPIEAEFRRRGDGTYDIGECFITVSLGEPFDGFCYKLVAAVITKSRCAGGAI